ncbi:hypothetical protein [Denitratisoma sp. DHT3]|uniref:hypothetical protein n=1 Tax=Denitratisoma sp. DHT3 TaxID=1981880 RepID=UPI001647BF1B|nr:hypothetical protein [Denitratisoma sp. DHT3]
MADYIGLGISAPRPQKPQGRDEPRNHGDTAGTAKTLGFQDQIVSNPHVSAVTGHANVNLDRLLVASRVIISRFVAGHSFEQEK